MFPQVRYVMQQMKLLCFAGVGLCAGGSCASSGNPLHLNHRNEALLITCALLHFSLHPQPECQSVALLQTDMTLPLQPSHLPCEPKPCDFWCCKHVRGFSGSRDLLTCSHALCIPGFCSFLDSGIVFLKNVSHFGGRCRCTHIFW